MGSKMLTLDEMIKLADKIAIQDWNDDYFTGHPSCRLDTPCDLDIWIWSNESLEAPGERTYSLQVRSDTYKSRSIDDPIQLPYVQLPYVEIGVYSGADERVASLYCAVSSSCAKRQRIRTEEYIRSIKRMSGQNDTNTSFTLHEMLALANLGNWRKPDTDEGHYRFVPSFKDRFEEFCRQFTEEFPPEGIADANLLGNLKQIDKPTGTYRIWLVVHQGHKGKAEQIVGDHEGTDPELAQLYQKTENSYRDKYANSLNEGLKAARALL